MSTYKSIFETVINSDLTECERMIKEGQDVNSKNDWENTPLHIAAYNGNFEISKLLIEHEANVNALDSRNNTALHRAAEEGNEDICKLLIDNEANVTLENKDHKTAKDLAEENKNYRAFHLLESYTKTIKSNKPKLKM